MELKIKEEELGDLKERTKEFLRWERVFRFNSVFCIIWFFLPIIIRGQILGSPTTYEAAPLFLIGSLLAAASILVPYRKKSEYKVKDVEWVKLYSFAVHNSLASYFGTDSLGLKKKSRQHAVEYAQSFLYAVRERWDVGDFSLVDSYKKEVIDFEKNLKARVLPALQGDDEDQLRKVSGLMYNLFYRSDKLELKDLGAINNEMSKEGGARFLKSKESGIIPYHRVMDAIRDKRIRPYILPLVLSGVVAGGVFVLLTSYYGSNPIVAAATIALFVGLLAFFKVKRGQGD